MRRAVLAGVAAAVAASCAGPAAALDRPVSQIVCAIRAVNPSVSVETATSWAGVIRPDAVERHFCPMTMVAIGWRESGLRATVVNDNRHGYFVGLTQVNAVHPRTACSSKALLQTEACQARIRLLMDPLYNLHRTAAAITTHRDMCRRITGNRPGFGDWLFSWQGYNRPGVVCNQRRGRDGRWHRLSELPKGTQAVIDKRRELLGLCT